MWYWGSAGLNDIEVGVVGFALPIGLSAFAAAAVIVIAGVSDETGAIRRMPWPAILMVCGVTMLVALVEKTGGMDVFTSLRTGAQP